MSFKTGTATDYFNLLTILRDFLCNQGHAWGLAYAGTGNGRLINAIGKSATVVQTITCTATSSTNFTVSGSVTGSMGSATVGSPFTHAQCDFQINAGGTAYVAGDVFTFNLSPKWTLLRFGGCSDAALRTASVAGAAAMFNDDFTTNAITTTSSALPFQVAVQMQTAIEVKAYSLWIGNSSSNVPTAWDLQYSDNGSSWTTAQSWTGQTWSTPNQRRDYTLSSSAGSHLYWRLNFTAGTTNITLSELKFYADAAFKWACSNSFQFAFRGPGVDGAQQVHALGYLNVNSGTGFWNWVWRGVRFWADPDLDITNIPNISNTHAHLLNANSVAYWIVAHGGRFVLLTRLSGVYEMSYIGYGLPYETPTNHPYPYIVGSPSNSITRLFSDTSDNAYRNPCDPSDIGTEVMIPSGLWREVRNRGSGTPPDGGLLSLNAQGKVWPWAQYGDGDAGNIGLMRGGVDGTKAILPTVILLGQDTHAWGEFDGVSWVTGSGNSAESLMQIGAVDYINFPNVFRSGVNHYAAVALD